MAKTISRRGFLGNCSKMMTAGALLAGRPALASSKSAPNPQSRGGVLEIDPMPRFELSPYLYMQFMEPLGTTDGSVDAAWDFNQNCWRQDVIDITKELSPTMLRWGGCFISYYRWKEGVGPMAQRKPMLNQLWGGIYNNQVGTHEFVDFCHQVGMEPLICVNFESDFRKNWAVSPSGKDRSGDAAEAAEWVDYCNNPANEMRRQHGHREPYGVKFWQIGNETSYGDSIDVEMAAKKTLSFAKSMRKADPSIQLIGWGEGDWAQKMFEIAGEELQYLAFHNGFGPGGEDSPLRGIEYRKDWAKSWEYFMNAYKTQQNKIQDMRERVAGLDIPLVITESHFFLPGRNRNEALSAWAAGVSNARILNVHERNGDLIKVATLADFCGTRWQNNAVIIPTPIGSGKSFMMPVAMVMALYRKHMGQNSVKVTSFPPDLDVTASRTGCRIFLHVVNTNRTQSIPAQFKVRGNTITSGRSFCIALEPDYEVFEYKPEITNPKESAIPRGGAWTFPAASVSAVELKIVS
jgi:alpha-N-arabinofuranosidase